MWHHKKNDKLHFMNILCMRSLYYEILFIDKFYYSNNYVWEVCTMKSFLLTSSFFSLASFWMPSFANLRSVS